VTANPAAHAAASLKVLLVESAATVARRAARAERVLSAAEVRWFWQACQSLDPVRRGALRMLLLCGGRLREVTEMEHAELDLDERLWRIPARRMKTGRAHVVPLTDEMLAVLADVPRRAGSPYVFTGAQGGPVSLGSRAKAQLEAAMQQAGGAAIDPWTLHHLRRVMRSGMAALGVSEVVAESCLAHVQKGIVAVYNRHDFLPERRAATERWNAHVLRIVTGGAVLPMVRRA
jgi:integrase